MTLDEVNELAPAAFMAAFGGIAEHTPWVAERAMSTRPYASRVSMVDAFQAAVAGAKRAEQRALIEAHPDLAGRAAIAGTLGDDSRQEQKGAGLDSLTPEEFQRFTALNAAYRSRFGCPFILAVKGATKHQILEAFERRVGGASEEEFWTALSQVMRIIRFRLEDKVRDDNAGD
jgi:2-oxo-4-hydroxy-4-carboxy-5-ureidoimidazoline decarboxylase